MKNCYFSIKRRLGKYGLAPKSSNVNIFFRPKLLFFFLKVHKKSWPSKIMHRKVIRNMKIRELFPPLPSPSGLKRVTFLFWLISLNTVNVEIILTLLLCFILKNVNRSVFMFSILLGGTKCKQLKHIIAIREKVLHRLLLLRKLT